MKLLMLLAILAQLALVDHRINQTRAEIAPLQAEISEAQKVVGGAETVEMIEKIMLVRKLEEELNQLEAERTRLLHQQDRAPDTGRLFSYSREG